MRKNGQAVTLFFKTWPNVDVVPTFQTTNSNGEVSHYNVPDMTREIWIPSRPKAHAVNMSNKNGLCGDEFKRIVKMIKWWNYQHSGLLSSYHIEVLALKIFDSKITSYPWGIYQFFDKAIPLTTSSLWHEVGYVDSYLDWQTREEAIKRLTTAKEKANDAWYKTYGDNDDDEGAIKIWQQIFGEEFPAYG